MNPTPTRFTVANKEEIYRKALTEMMREDDSLWVSFPDAGKLYWREIEIHDIVSREGVIVIEATLSLYDHDKNDTITTLFETGQEDLSLYLYQQR